MVQILQTDEPSPVSYLPASQNEQSNDIEAPVKGLSASNPNHVRFTVPSKGSEIVER